MKRLVSIGIIIVMMVSIVGCKDNHSISETISLDEHKQLMEELEKDYEQKLSEKETLIRFPVMDNEAMLASEMHYNEERDIYAYIDDVGFEVIGNVNLYDPTTGESTQITSYDYNGTDPTVKKLAWLSDNQLLLIVGFAYGTVTVGGSLYVLSIDTGELKEILVPSDHEEIIDIVLPDGGSEELLFVVAKWDDNFMNYETYNVDYTYTALKQMASEDQAIVLVQDTHKQREITSLASVISGDIRASLIKETEEDLLIGIHGYGNTGDSILQVDKESYEIKKEVKLGQVNNNRSPFNVTKMGVLVKSSEDMKLYNDDLELVKTYVLPELIKEAIDINSDLERFGGYDVNEDLSKFVFSDEEGLKLIDGETKLIIEPLYTETPDGSLSGYPVTPTFVGDKDNVMAMISGYEGYSGFYYYHRSADELEVYAGGCDRDFPDSYNGSDLINISPFYSDGYGDGFLMNTNDGSFLQMDRDHIDNDGNLIDNSLYFDMDHQILSIDEKNSHSQLILRSESLEIIHQASLNSDEEWVKCYIIGMTKEGKVLLLEGSRNKKVLEISWDM